MRVVLDTNALVVSIGGKSKYRPIMDAFLEEKFEMAFTTDIALEYFEIISKLANPDLAKNIVNRVVKAPNTYKAKVKFRWGLITTDPDDNKFVDRAVSARVRFVVTDDKHFNVLRSIDFPKVDVITLDDFLVEVLAME